MTPLWNLEDTFFKKSNKLNINSCSSSRRKSATLHALKRTISNARRFHYEDVLNAAKKHLKLIYWNETNEISFFLHFDTSRLNTGSNELSVVICNILSLLGFAPSSLALTRPDGLLLYSRSNDNITGYGEEHSWLSICKDKIWKKSCCWSKLCSRSTVTFVAQAKSNSCKMKKKKMNIVG